jgi:2-polyprenyl-3-methyl-5-hydroxy-6-metoxy-1,4-benzoquinol methylase
MNSAAFWDKRSKQYDDAIRKHDAPFDKTIERTKALLSCTDVVLDFGCGSGEFSLDLAPQVQRVHGIDTSSRMIELAKGKARDRHIDNTIFDQRDLFDHSLVSQSFSAVIAFSIFHLVGDASKTLARLNDLLPTGGLLISETPCFGGLAPTICSLSSGELESLVSSAGFEILESKIWDEKNALRWIVARKM